MMTMIDLREATKSIDKNARILDLKRKLVEQLAANAAGSGVQVSWVEHVSDLRRLHKESSVTAILIMEAVARQAPDLVVVSPGELARLTEALNRHQKAAAKAKEFLSNRDAKAQHNSRGKEAAREIEEFLENEGRRERRHVPN